jgi:SAM-dependent methyltransferase
MVYDYEQIVNGYYDHIFMEDRGVRGRWHHEKFEHVRSVLPMVERLADIGCGPGTFLGLLGQSIGEGVGIDTSSGQIAYAKDRYQAENLEFIHALRPPYFVDEASIDVVVMLELIEHLEANTIDEVLAEALRLLRPGGELLLTTPNYNSLWPLLEVVVNRMSDVNYEEQHITRFNRFDLEVTLAKAGFEVNHVTPFMFAVPFAAVFGWWTADMVARFEPRWLSARAGFLLLARAQKPT